MKNKMRRMRIALARMILTVTTPTTIYVLYKLGDPEYCPAIGWTFGFIVMAAFSCWSVKYSELFIKLPN